MFEKKIERFLCLWLSITQAHYRILVIAYCEISVIILTVITYISLALDISFYENSKQKTT